MTILHRGMAVKPDSYRDSLARRALSDLMLKATRPRLSGVEGCRQICRSLWQCIIWYTGAGSSGTTLSPELRWPEWLKEQEQTKSGS